MKKKRGGKRINAGRKKGVKTKVMRIPDFLEEDVKQFVKQKTTDHEKN